MGASHSGLYQTPPLSHQILHNHTTERLLSFKAISYERTRQAEFWSHQCAPSAKEHLPGGSGRRGGGLHAADAGWSGVRLHARSLSPETSWFVEKDGTIATTAIFASWCLRCTEQRVLLLQGQNKSDYSMHLTVLFYAMILFITIIIWECFNFVFNISQLITIGKR